MTNPEIARPTATGLLLRTAKDGATLMACHRSVNAGLHELTTVGGGVEPGESDIDAIKRELCEEYGYSSCDALQIIDLRYRATHRRRGKLKEYRWFLIIDHHRGNVTKVNPESEEVAEIRWERLDLFPKFASCFSPEKREMIERAIELLHKNYPQLLRSRRVA